MGSVQLSVYCIVLSKCCGLTRRCDFFTGGDHVSNLVLSSAQENRGKRSFVFSRFLPQTKCTDLRMNTEEFFFIAFFPVWPPPHGRREIRGYR